MSKIHVSVFLGLSLDGYIAGEGGDLEWMNICNIDPPEDSGYIGLMNRIDCMVMGRATYDKCLTFDHWPCVGKRVVVMTNREAQSKYGETFFKGSLTELLPQLQAEGVKAIYLDGGHVVRQGIEENIVDELTLSWLPIILGKGIPLFDNTLSRRLWKLIDHSTYRSGLVQAKYVRV